MVRGRGILRLLTAGAALLGLVGVAGCANLRDVPLPGLVSGPTFAVSAQFTSALGLPEQAAVRYRGAIIGEVVRVQTADYLADVDLRIIEAIDVPADVRAEIRFTSPLGEAFVEFTDPTRERGAKVAEPLGRGDRIGVEATSAAPSATDLLASVSTLVTGGSFADMKVIITELNNALTGNTGNVRQLVQRAAGTLTRLNARTADFDRALTSLDRLSGQLVGDRQLIDRSIAAIAPAISTLSQQSGEMLKLAAQLRRLSTVGTTTIAQTRSALTSVLTDLEPILRTLERNEANFAPLFEGIREFGRKTEGATYGMFSNFDLKILIKPTDLFTLPGAGNSP